MHNLSQKIKLHRLSQDKTQQEMAELLNVQRATYGEYERGKNIPPVDKLKIIAETFNVSIDYLVDMEPQNQDIADMLQGIIVMLQDASESVLYQSKEINQITQEMLCCTISHALEVTNILIEDDE